MAIPAVVDSLDSVPASLRTEYQPIADGPLKGKFIAQLEGAHGYSLAQVDVLRSAIETERQRARELDARAKAYGDVTPEQAREALTNLEKLKGAVPKDQLDTFVQAEAGKIKSTFENQLKERDGKLTQREKQLREVLIMSEGRRALVEAGFEAKSAGLLLKVLSEEADIDGLDGSDLPRVYLKNEKGGRRMTQRQGSQADMDLTEWAESMREQYPALVKGGGAKGSGASGGSKSGSGSGGRFTITKAEAANTMLYRQKREEALKAGAMLQVID